VSVEYGQAFFAGRSETVAASAAAVAPVVRELLDPLSLLDVGCGEGEWLEAFALDDAVGVDIATHTEYLQHNLVYPLHLHRTFDLVLCLEVGEHLPVSAADVLVDTLVRHGRTIVFSAAVPGQVGKGHINLQPHSYWHDKFTARGYTMLDVIRPRIARNYAVSAWYRDNVFLYLHA
jgi:SAM-dependent methyltransferase